jgi:hypothetical protein
MYRKLLLMASLQLILVSCGTVLTKTPVPDKALSHDTEMSRFRKPHDAKVVLVILENKNADEAYSPTNRFLWRLAEQGAYLSNYYGIAHPSQPNYVALISGSTKGVHDDSPARLQRTHLGQELEQKLGPSSWMSYAEGYPSGTCNTNTTIGRYVRKHEPFMSFADVQDHPDRCTNHITGFDDFRAAASRHRLPSFSLVIPNLDHDAHDQPLRVADEWLEENFRDLLEDAEFKRDVILIVTFDENDARWPYLKRNDNKVYTALWGDHVIRGKVETVYDHYDLLRTIEAIFDLSPMSEEDRNARVIEGILQ